MATVGNLFVTVGANTANLQKNLTAAEQRIQQFKQKVSKAGSIGDAFSKMKPISFGPLELDIAGLKAKFDGVAKSIAGNVKEVNALKAAVSKVAAAEQKVRDTQSLRKSAGMARAAIGAAGFDPSKALPQVQDTAKLAANVKAADASVRSSAGSWAAANAGAANATRITNDLIAAKQRLISLERRQAEAAAIAGGQKMPLVQRVGGKFAKVPDLAAAKANNQAIDDARARHGRLTEAISKQQAAIKSLSAEQTKSSGAFGKVAEAAERTRVATEKYRAAKAALALAEARNAKILKVSAEVRARGFDPSKAIKLPDLGAAKQAVHAAEMEKNLASAALSAARLTTALIATGAAAAAGSAAVGLLAHHTIHAANEMGRLEDTALRVGASVTELQDLNNSMRQLGATPEAAEMGMLRLSVKLEDAIAGGSEAVEAFESIGVAVKDLEGQSAVQQFNTVTDAIRELDSQASKVKALREIFGRGGLGLASAVNRTPQEVAAVREEAVSVRIPAETVNRLADLDDSMVHLHEGFKRVQMELAGAFAPAVADAAHHLSEMMAEDPQAMLQGLQSVATTVAVIADVLNVVVGVLRFAFNIVQSLAEFIGSTLSGALGTVVKAVEWILWGLEKISGLDLGSAAVGEFADTLLVAAKNLATDGLEDMGEAFTGAASHMKFGATTAVADGVMNGYKRAEEYVGANPLNIKTTAEKAAAEAAVKAAEDRAKSIQSILQGQRDENSRLVLGDVGFKRKQLQEAGGSQSDLISFDATQALIERHTRINELVEQRKRNEQEVVTEMARLASEYDAIGASEAQLLQRKLEGLGATRKQVDEALALLAATEAANAQTRFADYLANQQKALDAVQGNTEALLRAELQGMGLVGSALEQALQQAVAMNAKISEAEKAKAAQEQAIADAEAKRKGIEGTIAAMRIESAQLGMTNAQKVADNLSREGATEAQIAEAVRLQESIDKFNAQGGADSAAGVSDTTASVDTALGNMKLGMPSEAVAAALRTAALSEQQLAVLKQMENLLAVGSAADFVGGGTVAGGLDSRPELSGGASVALPAMDRMNMEVLSEERKHTVLLTAIANNTAAFAEVLT